MARPLLLRRVVGLRSETPGEQRNACDLARPDRSPVRLAAEPRRSSVVPDPTKKVIILDDDPSSAGGLKALLRLDGWDAVTVATPEEALGWMDHLAVRAFVAELRLARTDLIRRAIQRRPGLCVFVVTPFERTRACARALEQGASEVFVKPLDYEYFQMRLRGCLFAGGAF